jgi:hypothetical protein
MQSILGHFKETKNDLFEGAGSRNKYIKNINIVPKFHCPEIGSKTNKDDLAQLRWYYDNKSLSNNFLTTSDASVKKLYKMFCKENNINVDWKKIKDILKDVHAIVWSLKNKYKRPRPKTILIKEDDIYNDIIDTTSYSFPSGHTTTAYFLSEILSYFYPNVSRDLKNLSELIGQSRIENCVHYPSDVLHGKFLGELLAKSFLAGKNIEQHAFSHVKIKKNNIKKLQSLLYEKQKANKYFLYDMTDFIMKATDCGDYNDTHRGIKNFIKGYPIEQCSNNKTLKNYLKVSTLFNEVNGNFSIFDYISANKIIAEEKPIIRYYKTHHQGYLNSKPEKIINHLAALENLNNPFSKNIVFSLIEPFCQGNNIIAAAELLKNTEYDIKKCHDFLNVFDSKLALVKEKHENINILINTCKFLKN